VSQRTRSRSHSAPQATPQVPDAPNPFAATEKACEDHIQDQIGQVSVAAQETASPSRHESMLVSDVQSTSCNHSRCFLPAGSQLLNRLQAALLWDRVRIPLDPVCPFRKTWRAPSSNVPANVRNVDQTDLIPALPAWQSRRVVGWSGCISQGREFAVSYLKDVQG
jgi:hypothetical protein